MARRLQIREVSILAPTWGVTGAPSQKKQKPRILPGLSFVNGRDQYFATMGPVQLNR